MAVSTGPESVRTGINRCIAACDALVTVSEDCAHACLRIKGNGDITRCFFADLDCIEVCSSTSRLLSWHARKDGLMTIALLETCREAARASIAACENMARLHPGWHTCSMACRRVDEACARLLAVLR
ncbi:four-helix bundle copper-binding protein [Cryobacterium sp. TMT1-62]|uniref:Four-helix bundle copper-binding protein n=1 Tax=Cryobacterium sandaracinum TaxID=1259247 RepID=A0ABY2JAD0_9MICO|nr:MULTISPECIES: four-helix bundle copper-binding protein [Cryobacterium]TFB57174.1 four-helix bundle copper-binding protein [Cryobacterium sp. Sr3]TFC33176.1 four-helix bundle copper-binding protein [Cryobacterium sp. TMT2-14]TFC51532.1 four-helix bundle copper-binding protein [Cryobacterium sp. TMT2-17-1]TFC71743.1 four-helix bundle copper-binding protein [Cryobacterium sp. TMT2-4]TFD01775.1 four-helix bundle copper-binding protein [Cryobacterium sandaracinum]